MPALFPGALSKLDLNEVDSLLGTELAKLTMAQLRCRLQSHGLSDDAFPQVPDMLRSVLVSHMLQGECASSSSGPACRLVCNDSDVQFTDTNYEDACALMRIKYFRHVFHLASYARSCRDIYKRWPRRNSPPTVRHDGTHYKVEKKHDPRICVIFAVIGRK